jgi:hypothetical protein
MSESQDKLSWLAFRYVANEMDTTEANDFESLLLNDQAAREAVAVAVSETTQIRQALATVVTGTSQRSGWSRRSTRFAVVAMGSCLTLFLAVCLVRSSLPPERSIVHQLVASPPSDSVELAYAWAEARHGLAEVQSAGNVVLTDSLDTVSIAAIDSEFEHSLVAPSWMLAALAKIDSGVESEFEPQE